MPNLENDKSQFLPNQSNIGKVEGWVCALARCRRGAIAVEFAFIGPVFILLLMGIVGYGGYFWISHAVQQVANDAARAAVAGLTTDERRQLAASAVTAEIGDYAFLKPTLTTVTVKPSTDRFSVVVSYDASASVFWALSDLVPMPPSAVTGAATVRLGGY